MFELHHERDVETSDLQGTNTVNALFNEVGTTSVTNYYLYQNLFLLAKYTSIRMCLLPQTLGRNKK